MYTNTSDVQLLETWRSRRDADAFAELVARYAGRFARFAPRLDRPTRLY